MRDWLTNMIHTLSPWLESASELYRPTVGESLRWSRDTLYPLKLVLTSPTSGGRSVGRYDPYTVILKSSWNFLITIIIILFLILQHRDYGDYDEWWITKDLEGSCHGVIEILFRNLIGGNRENLRHDGGCPGLDLIPVLPKCKSRALPLHESARCLWPFRPCSS
jgi:hypothetical protein